MAKIGPREIQLRAMAEAREAGRLKAQKAKSIPAGSPAPSSRPLPQSGTGLVKREGPEQVTAGQRRPAKPSPVASGKGTSSRGGVEGHARDRDGGSAQAGPAVAGVEPGPRVVTQKRKKAPDGTFDKKAYQLDYMRKKRAADRAKKAGEKL